MVERLVFLIRHAQPVRSDKIKRYLGQSDPCLSDLGIQQAELLAYSLRNQNIRALYCSDLARSEQTALIIEKRFNCHHIKIKGLREIDMGEWEGMSFEDVKSLYPEEFDRRGKDIVNYRSPGGESFADLNTRVIRAYENIVENSSGNIIIVGHSGVNRVILSNILKLPLDRIFSIKQDYAGVNTIIKNTGSSMVKFVNRTFYK